MFASVGYAAKTSEKIFERTPPPAKVRTYEASESVSHYIRDNAPDYWRWTKSNGREYFGKIMDFEGIVVGDSHPGNFIYSPLAGKMKYFMMDIKDAGKGPLISDIAHQIMATNAIFEEGEEDLDRSTERQLEAYLAGLKGKQFEAHDRISEIFENTKTDYKESVDEYVDDKTTGSRFRLKDEKIEALEDHISSKVKLTKTKNDITKAVTSNLKGAKVLDYAYRPRERGGSKNLLRYWVLVKQRNTKFILEFKEIDAPAVAQYTPQLPAIKRFNLIMKTLWGTLDPHYQAVEVAGAPFWMRPKKVDMFDVPYKQKDKDARKFVRHLGAYDAYILGRYHGGQAETKKYKSLVEEKFDQLVESINEMSDDYIDRLVGKVETLQESKTYQ